MLWKSQFVFIIKILRLFLKTERMITINTKEFTFFDLHNMPYDRASKLTEVPYLDESGEIVPVNEQIAIVTHYLNLLHSDNYLISYTRAAEDILRNWAELLGKDKSTNNLDTLKESTPYGYLFANVIKAPFKPVANPTFRFIDLFAGIGGFRIAMQKCGGECVYSSEWDVNAQKTYYHNFGDVPFGDITKESNKRLIPNGFDVLCAGFPCQAFSIAGYRKGFEDTRGTLFFDVAEIIRRKRPKAVYLENVKNLYTHDGGKTFEVIKNSLEELGYVVYHQVMNAMEYANIPQNRERIFIVCFDPQQVPNHNDFCFPQKEKLTKTIHDCINYNEKNEKLFYGDKMGHIQELRDGITSKDTIYQWRRQYVRENKSNVCPTLTANMGTGGHNVPLILTNYGIRKLSPKECLNFQGFPAQYTFPDNIADSAKYKQAGNSVVVPLIYKVCKNIISIISKNS